MYSGLTIVETPGKSARNFLWGLTLNPAMLWISCGNWQLGSSRKPGFIGVKKGHDRENTLHCKFALRLGRMGMEAAGVSRF